MSTSTTTPFTSHYANVNGIRMYYEMYGTGYPLVLIHGGGSTIQTSFANIIPLLARQHQIIAVELQAHGRTGDRHGPISFEQDADDVAALLQHIGIAQADVMGFSNGGNTTIQLAIRHPARVHQIIVASAFYKRRGMPDAFWEFMKKGTRQDMPAALQEAFLSVTPDDAKLQNLFEKCAARMINFVDWDDSLLTSIQAPTLIVAGDRDVARPDHYVTMAQLIPHAQLMILPGGHGEYMGEISFPRHDDQTQAFVCWIEKFLMSTSR